MTSRIQVKQIESNNSNPVELKGNVVFENLMPVEGNGYFLRKVQRMYRIDNYTDFSTSFTHMFDFTSTNTNSQSSTNPKTNTPVLAQWPDFGPCKKNSKIYFEIYFPADNQSNGWGGVYVAIDARVRLNDDTFYSEWISLGGSGHVIAMNQGDEDYEHYRKSFWIDPQELFPKTRTNDFYLNMKWWARTNDSTGYVSTRRSDVNRGGDTNFSQHSNHFNVEMIFFEYCSIQDNEYQEIYDPKLIYNKRFDNIR